MGLLEERGRESGLVRKMLPPLDGRDLECLITLVGVCLRYLLMANSPHVPLPLYFLYHLLVRERERGNLLELLFVQISSLSHDCRAIEINSPVHKSGARIAKFDLVLSFHKSASRPLSYSSSDFNVPLSSTT